MDLAALDLHQPGIGEASPDVGSDGIRFIHPGDRFDPLVGMGGQEILVERPGSCPSAG